MKNKYQVVTQAATTKKPAKAESRMPNSAAD